MALVRLAPATADDTLQLLYLKFLLDSVALPAGSPATSCASASRWRRRHGAKTEVIVLPRDISFDADTAAASTFSLSIRRYSADEHLFCAISSARRV
jgi:hypothetical protein